MKVTLPEVSDLELYTFEKIAHAVNCSIATVRKHRADPLSPLFGSGMRFVPGSRHVVASAETLRAYIRWIWDQGTNTNPRTAGE